MRIEAAAYQGKPVYFELIGPWTRPARMQPYQYTAGEKAFFLFFSVFLVVLLVASAMLARRNLRLGRGDRQGAFQLASFVFTAWAVSWFFGAHHVSNVAELGRFVEFLVWGSGYASFTWLLYIALEPFVRRRWPATLISWSRLLAGRIQDPLVGRDVLIGALAAAFLDALERIWWFIPSWLGHPPTQPLPGPDWQFLGVHTIIASIADALKNGPLAWIAVLFVLVLLRALLRKQWAATAAFVVLLAAFIVTLNPQLPPEFVAFFLILSGVSAFLLIRCGLLCGVAFWVFDYLISNFPLTTQGSAWYWGVSVAAILLMAVIAGYAFHTSLGDRAAFGGGAAFEE